MKGGCYHISGIRLMSSSAKCCTWMVAVYQMLSQIRCHADVLISRTSHIEGSCLLARLMLMSCDSTLENNAMARHVFVMHSFFLHTKSWHSKTPSSLFKHISHCGFCQTPFHIWSKTKCIQSETISQRLLGELSDIRKDQRLHPATIHSNWNMRNVLLTEDCFSQALLWFPVN